ncbi:unnamed protein product, partial [Meganyctiphanes norvegica]
MRPITRSSNRSTHISNFHILNFKGFWFYNILLALWPFLVLILNIYGQLNTSHLHSSFGFNCVQLRKVSPSGFDSPTRSSSNTGLRLAVEFHFAATFIPIICDLHHSVNFGDKIAADENPQSPKTNIKGSQGGSNLNTPAPPKAIFRGLDLAQGGFVRVSPRKVNPYHRSNPLRINPFYEIDTCPLKQHKLEHFMQTAWRERNPDVRIKSAHTAMELNPECASAYILLGEEECTSILEVFKILK